MCSQDGAEDLKELLTADSRFVDMESGNLMHYYGDELVFYGFQSIL